MRCIMTGINATMASIEFSIDGTILHANELFKCHGLFFSRNLLNAIYNPILNAGGEVVKVVKLATHMKADSHRYFQALNSIIPFVIQDDMDGLTGLSDMK